MKSVKDFLYGLPAKANHAALEGLHTRFHFDIADSGQYTVVLEDGQISVADGLEGAPTCVVKSSEDAFGKVISGDLNPMMAMMTGKLKISNPGEMIKFAKMFGIM